MIVRIASVQVAPERIDEIVGRYRETVRPIHQHSDGLRNHYVLVDRQSGQMRQLASGSLKRRSRRPYLRLNQLASGSGAGSTRYRLLRPTRLPTGSKWRRSEPSDRCKFDYCTRKCVLSTAWASNNALNLPGTSVYRGRVGYLQLGSHAPNNSWLGTPTDVCACTIFHSPSS
jgi:hypothetical protein